MYALTNQATDQEKDDFYTRLQQVYSQVPKQVIVLLRGDFNAKIGTGAPISKFALGKQNHNGERQFGQTNGLPAVNARVRQHPRHQYTWCTPGGTRYNQIDYILAPHRWPTSVGKCKTCPCADADTDHILLRMRFKLKLARLVLSRATTTPTGRRT